MGVNSCEGFRGKRGAMRLTQPKGKHVGQRPRDVVGNMELTRHQHNPPPRRALPARLGQRIPEDEQTARVEGAQHRPHDELRVPEARQPDERLAQPREQHGAEERARHGPREGEVVVGGGEARRGGARGRAVDEDVVRGLQVERLLDFGVRGGQEVEEGDEEEEGVEEHVFTRRQGGRSQMCLGLLRTAWSSPRGAML